MMIALFLALSFLAGYAFCALLTQSKVADLEARIEYLTLLEKSQEITEALVEEARREGWVNKHA